MTASRSIMVWVGKEHVNNQMSCRGEEIETKL